MSESELVKVTGITFDTADGSLAFANGVVYPMNTAAMEFRTTFYDVNYIGTTVPLGTWDIVGLPNTRYSVNQFTARELADFAEHVEGPLPTPEVTITRTADTVYLDWQDVTGANSGYRVEWSYDPYGPFTPIVPNVSLSEFSEPASAQMKFYQVIAVP